MRADFLHPAVFDYQDAVGHADGAEAVGDEHGGFALRQLLEALEDLVLGAGVEGGGGLVEDEQLYRTSWLLSLVLWDMPSFRRAFTPLGSTSL